MKSLPIGIQTRGIYDLDLFVSGCQCRRGFLGHK